MRDKASLVRALCLIAGPPLIWFLHFNALYIAKTIECRFGVSVSLPMIVTTLIAAGALILATRSSRRSGGDEIARWSFCLAAIAGLGIAWSSVAALLAPANC